MILFGSRARGEALRDSDLDILVVSGAFEAIPWLERPVRVFHDCDIRMGVELLCYTPQEYEQKLNELGIVRTATDEGIDLLAA